jgi:ADP-ribose pyrophosphatase YjhB (NUDIX family)
VYSGTLAHASAFVLLATASGMVRALPIAEEDVVWRHADGSAMPLRVTCYVGSAPSDERLVTSVRAVVLRGNEVLVLRNADAVHALPGGRREPGESFEETLRREVLEETGYAIRRPRPLGFAHLQHLAPPPAGYAFPHPDFYWTVYAAECEARRGSVPHDDYERGAAFQPVARALERIDLPSRVYVQAALEKTRQE